MSTQKRNPGRVLWTVAGQLLMVVTLYLMAIRLVDNSKEIVGDLGQMQLGPLVGALILTLTMELLMPLGWMCALRSVGVQVPFRLSFCIYYQTSILRYLPGSFWNFPGRAYLSQQRGISLGAFSRSAFFELFFLLGCAGVLAAWGVAQYLRIPALSILSVVVVLGMLSVAILPYRLISKKAKDFLSLELIQKRYMFAMMLIYTLVWLSYGGAVGLVLLALPGIPSFDPVSFIPTNTAAWVVGFMSPSPGGLGVRELGLATMMGQTLASTAIVASLTQRVMEVVLEGLLWIIARTSGA